MAKELPRHKVISQYEAEFKKEYAKHIGAAFMLVFKKLEEFVEEGKKGVQAK